VEVNQSAKNQGRKHISFMNINIISCMYSHSIRRDMVILRPIVLSIQTGADRNRAEKFKQKQSIKIIERMRLTKIEFKQENHKFVSNLDFDRYLF